MLCFLFCYVSLFIMFFVAFCFLSRSIQIRYILYCSVTFCRVISCFLFNKMDCTYTLLYIIDKGGRKNFFVRMYRLCFAKRRCRLSRTSLSAFTNTKVRH